MTTTVRDRLLKDAIDRGDVNAADVAAAERRRAEYQRFGLDVPTLELIADSGRLPIEVAEEASRGEEIPSRIAGLDVIRPAGGTPERPVFLVRRATDGETFLVHACMRSRADAPTQVDTFVRAMEDGRRLTGPGWIPVLDAGGADGAYAAICPVPDGLRLDERLASRGHLSPENAVAVMKRVAEALWQMEALGRAATFPDPSLVLVGGPGAGDVLPDRVLLAAIEVLLAGRSGSFDAQEFARSAANFLARLVGPERVTDPAVHGLLADLSSGRFDALRPDRSAASSIPTHSGLGSPALGTTSPSSPFESLEVSPDLADTPIGLHTLDLGPSYSESVAGARTATRDGFGKPATGPALPKWLYVALGAGLVVVIALAVRGALGPSAATSSSAPADSTPPSDSNVASVASAGRASSRETASSDRAAGVSARDDGLVALEEALTFLSAHREDEPQKVIDRLRAIESRFAGTPAGSRAATERERFEHEVESEADRRALAVASDVERFLAADEIGAARAAIDAFPRALQFTKAVVRLDALRSRVQEKAEGVYTAVRPTIDDASDPSRQAAARAAVERVRALGDPDLSARAEQRLKDAISRATGIASRRKEFAPELARVRGEALVAAGSGDVDRGRRLVEAASRGPLGDAFGDALASARGAIDRVARVYEVASGEWRTRAGKGGAAATATVLLREYGSKPFAVTPTDASGDRVAWTRGGAPGAARLAALDADSVVALATASGREADGAIALGVATLYASTGRKAEAEAALSKAAALGAAASGAATFVEEADAARAHLATLATRECAAGDAAIDRDKDAARAAYVRAATLAPGLALPHRRLGDLLAGERAEKSLEDAFVEYGRARSLGDAGPDVLFGLARTAAGAGRPDEEALGLWREFVAVAPVSDARAATARTEIERLAAKVARGSTMERIRAAKALLDAGKPADAVLALEDAVAADPTSMEARRALARAAEKAGDADHVVVAYLAWREIKGLSRTAKEVTEAKEQLDRLERAFGERGAEQTVRKGAETALARGEHATAVEGMKRAVAMSPLDVEARIGLGTALMGLGQKTGTKTMLDDALAAYAAATRIAPDDARPWYFRGELRRQRGDLDGAIADETAAIERRRDQFAAYNSRGLAHYQAGHLEAALADLDVVCTLAPLIAMPRISRAGIRIAMGKMIDAEADLAAALERSPTEQEKALIAAYRKDIAARQKPVGK